MTVPTPRFRLMPDEGALRRSSPAAGTRRTVQETALPAPSAGEVAPVHLAGQGVSPRQQRIDRGLIIGLAYGMYALYMGLPVVNALVGIAAATALGVTLWKNPSLRPAGAWRVWSLAVALTALGIAVPPVAHRLGLVYATPAGMMVRSIPPVIALLVAHRTIARLPLAFQRAFCVRPNR